jgi:hypothetical protein
MDDPFATASPNMPGARWEACLSARWIAMMAWLMAGLASPAFAQCPSSEAGAAKSTQNPAPAWYEAEWKGLRPDAGIVVPGSGAAAGLTWRLDKAIRLPVPAALDAMVSIRNYQHVALRVGGIERMRQRWELGAPDAPLHGFYRSPTRPVVPPRAAAYVELRYRRLPALSLFGAPEGSPDVVETDYGQQLLGADAVASWQPTSRLAIGARLGWLESRGLPPGNDDTVNSDLVFARRDVQPGIVSTFIPVGAGFAYGVFPSRHLPDAAVLTAAVWRFVSLSAGTPSFARVEAVILGSRRMWTPSHVLAGRVAGSAILGGPDVPMAFRQTLGGSNTMRSYHSYRLRGSRLLTAALESRWRVHRSVDVVPFAELAAVGAPPVRLLNTAVIPAWGVGIRWWLSDTFVVRADAGFSRDERRVLLTVGTPF